METRVHHFGTKKPAAYFTKSADTFSFSQRRLLTGVKAEKAQGQFTTAILRTNNHLPARAILDFAGLHHHLDLYRLTPGGINHPGNAGFILVTQRQMDQ